MARFCIYCGKEVNESSLFCFHCGKELSSNKTEPEKKDPVQKKGSLLNPICCVCGNNAGITAVGNRDIIKMLCPTCRKKITASGYRYSSCTTEQCKRIVAEYDEKDITLDRSDCFTNVKNIEKVLNYVRQNVNNEKILVILKGAFKEYLICTDKYVYIIKKGFMTGHTFGKGYFKMPYSNISNVEIDFHLATGYFEISAPGLENKRLNYWSRYESDEPRNQPNCITITGADLRNQFEKAATIILNRINESKNPTTSVVNNAKSTAEEIREFKRLFDDGIITEEEFNKKKKELLKISE